MAKPKLSILIPSKDEELLHKTIQDVLAHIEGDTEIIVGFDGWIKDTYIYDNPKIDWVIRHHGIGQRAMTNELAKISKAQYLMKIDAHCSFSQGFDVKLMAEMDDKTILSPMLLPLYPESWEINGKKQMLQFNFGKDFVMQHTEGDEGETMCLQGSAWMIERENYWKWNVCDESLGSWGGQAVELGIAAWLNGGRCKTTRSAYYGHVFRHKDEEFPYERGANPGQFATLELKRRYENDPRIAELAKKFGKEWN